MNNSIKNLKKILSPSVILAGFVVLCGLAIIIFIEDLPIRLIGISIIILGVVSLVMMLSRRLNTMVDSEQLKFRPASENYTVTTKQDKRAKIQTIEDFTSFSVEEKDDYLEIEESYNKTDEGFKFVGGKKQVKPQSFVPSEIDYNSRTVQIKEDEQVQNIEFSEEISEVKILSNYKTLSKNKISESEQSQSKVEINDELIEEVPKINVKQESKIELEKEKVEINVKKDKHEKKPRYKSSHFDLPIATLMEKEPLFGNEPRKEFEYFLHKVLKIIRSVTKTRTATIFIVNFSNNELVLMATDSDVPQAITSKKKFNISKDIVSQIIKNIKPEILTEINQSAELELLPYYISPVGTLSFIGVPIFYNEKVVGILCADSEQVNAYDQSIVGFFGHFTRLLSSLIQNYIGKYDLIQNSRTLEAINLIRHNFDSELKSENIVETAINAINLVFNFETIGISSYDIEKKSWVIKAYQSKTNKNNFFDLQLELNDTLVGQSIIQSKSIFINENLNENIRVNKNESKLNTGLFVSIPFNTAKKTYGALFIEDRNPLALSSNDIKVLETITEHIAIGFELVFSVKQPIVAPVADTTNRIIPSNVFYKKLNEELQRAKDQKQSISICLISIDRYQSMEKEHSNEAAEELNKHLSKIVIKRMRQYDLFSELDTLVYGIGLVGIKLQESKFWAEKLRSDYAVTPVHVKSKQYSLTISIGIAEAKPEEGLKELMAHAERALNISRQKSNTVTIF